MEEYPHANTRTVPDPGRLSEIPDATRQDSCSFLNIGSIPARVDTSPHLLKLRSIHGFESYSLSCSEQNWLSCSGVVKAQWSTSEDPKPSRRLHRINGALTAADRHAPCWDFAPRRDKAWRCDLLRKSS